MKTFKRTVQLNPTNCPSTGSATIYSGKSPWPTMDSYHFLEIADCSKKIRLHNTQMETKKEFLVKLKKLHKFIGEAIAHLEKE